MIVKFYFLWTAYTFGNLHALKKNGHLKHLKRNLNKTYNVSSNPYNNSIQLINDSNQKMRNKIHVRHLSNDNLMTQTDSNNNNPNCDSGNLDPFLSKNSIHEDKNIIVSNEKNVRNMKTNSEKPCIRSINNSSDYEKNSDANKYYDNDDGYDEYYESDGKLEKENEKYNESKATAVKENENDKNKIIIDFKTPYTSKQDVKPNSLFMRINKGDNNYIERDNVSRLVNSVGSKCVKKIVNHLGAIINEVLSNNNINPNITEEKFHIRNLGEKKLVKDHIKNSGKKKRGTKLRRKSEKLHKQKWTEWSDWSTCSVSCGRGRSVRWRTCIHPEYFDSVRYEMEQVPCQLPDCSPFSFKFFN